MSMDHQTTGSAEGGEGHVPIVPDSDEGLNILDPRTEATQPEPTCFTEFEAMLTSERSLSEIEAKARMFAEEYKVISKLLHKQNLKIAGLKSELALVRQLHAYEDHAAIKKLIEKAEQVLLLSEVTVTLIRKRFV